MKVGGVINLEDLYRLRRQSLPAHANERLVVRVLVLPLLFIVRKLIICLILFILVYNDYICSSYEIVSGVRIHLLI